MTFGRLLRCLFAGLLVGLLAPAVAGASSAPVFAGRAVIEAPAGGSVTTVRLASRLRLSTMLALPPEVLTVKGSGDMVLVVLRAPYAPPGTLPAQVVWGKTRAADGGDVRVAPTGSNSDNRKEVVWEDPTLAPGDYRLYVVAAAPVRLALTLPGSSGPTVRVRTRGGLSASIASTAPKYVGGVPAPTDAVGQTRTVTGTSLSFVFLIVDLSTQLGTFDAGLCVYRGGPPAGQWLPTCPTGLVGIAGDNGVYLSGRKRIAWGVSSQIPAGVWGIGQHYDFTGTAQSVHAYQAWLTY